MTGTTNSSRSLGAIEVGELARPLEPDAGRQSRALGDEPPCAVHVVSDGATMNPIDRVEKWNFVGVVAAEVSEPWGAGALVEHCTYWGLYFRRYHLFDT